MAARGGWIALLVVGSACAPAPTPLPAARPPDPVTAAPPPSGSVTASPPSLAPAVPPRVRFLAVGDVMLARGVARAMEAHGDAQWPFRPLADLFAAVDFTFANLEAPFAQQTTVPLFGNVFNAPRGGIAGLVAHGFRALNLANNHALDQGYQGLLDTLAWVRAHDRVAFGAGRTVEEAWTPGIVEAHGIRVGFLGASYCSVNDQGATWLPYVARVQDARRLDAAVTQLKQEVDFVVVTMHAGVEYAARPFALQHRFVEAAVAAGADMIIGAHPHVVQPVEEIDGVWVFYSLGNFVFDLGERGGDEGAALDITLTRGDEGVALTGLRVMPVVIEDGAPRPLEGDRSEALLRRMQVDHPTLVPRPRPSGSSDASAQITSGPP